MYSLTKPINKLTIEDVRKRAEGMLSNRRRINDMTVIKVKCWLYHSESRHKNGNEPFSFDNYVHHLGKETYLSHIEFDMIDCSDIGGKKRAIEIVNRWYS